MWTDVVDLRDFYAGALGRVARAVLRRRVREIWPDVRGLNMLGIGYPTPYLGVFRAEAQRVIAAMPAGQGVLHWPTDGPGLSVLTDDVELPLPDLSMDRVLLVHALEHAGEVRPLMREVWRVLGGGGRLLVVVPNRRGIWSRMERTPFGQGEPYSADQLARLLRDTMFTPTRIESALFVPPVDSRMVLGSAAAIENAGRRWFSAIAGAIVAEASKQIYAGQPAQRRTRRMPRVYAPVPERGPGTPFAALPARRSRNAACSPNRLASKSRDPSTLDSPP